MDDIKQKIAEMSPEDIAEIIGLIGKKFTVLDDFLERNSLVESFAEQLTGEGMDLMRDILLTAMANKIRKNKESVNEA